MIAYLIKLTICSGILLAVYHLLLEKEKMHRFNRFYLLFSVVFCFIVPLIPIRLEEDIAKAMDSPIVKVIPIDYVSAPLSTTNYVEEPVYRINIVPLLVFLIYILVAGALLVRLFLTIIKYLRDTRNKGTRFKNARLILSTDSTATHTFLNAIFISKTDYDYNGEIVDQEVLTHELTHVQQKHSLDVLFIELARSIAWFNPFFILYKRAIQLNHEFLADDTVNNTYKNIAAYQHLLLDKISQHSHHYLSSSLNFLIAKKRLAMMNKMKNNKRATIKTIVVVALMTGVFFLFSEKTYAQVIKNSATKDSILKARTGPQIWNQTQGDSTTPKPPKVNWKGPVHGDGVTQEQVDEYEKGVTSAYKLKTAPNGERYFQVDVAGLDIKHLRSIYLTMSVEQQRNATMLLGYIPKYPNPTPRSPSAEQLKQWQDPSFAGVWIDGKRVDNKVLATYKPSDFAYFFVSKLNPNATNYGKHKYQVNLDTPDYFKKAWPEEIND